MKIPFSDLELMLRDGRIFLGKGFDPKQLIAQPAEKIMELLGRAKGLLPNLKMGTIKEADLKADALKGALIAGGLAIPSAALYAYGNDEPVLKTLAKAQALALPLGAVAGGMGFPASRAYSSATDALGQVPDILNKVTPKLTEALELGKSKLPSMQGASEGLSAGLESIKNHPNIKDLMYLLNSGPRSVV